MKIIKKTLPVLLLSLAILAPADANPVRKTLRTGGFDREYLVYAPNPSRAGKPAGIIVCLHGLNSSMNAFFDEYRFNEIADSLNYVLISPQALPEQEQSVHDAATLLHLLTGQTIPLDAVWGCGLSVKAQLKALDITLVSDELNKHVDDSGFIDQILARTLGEYAPDERNIFVVGTSMGGYMAYQWTLTHDGKLSGLVSIVGSMGLSIRGMEKKVQLPVCDFHSTTDEVVPYAGSFEQAGTLISLAQNKEEVIRYWVQNNSATAVPVEEDVRYYPSTNDITVKKFTYPDPQNEVIHYRMNGSKHNYFFRKEAGDCMDYGEEILKFIASHATPPDDSGNTAAAASPGNPFYPNPAGDRIHIAGATGGTVSVYDLSGREVLTGTIRAEQLDVSGLKRGIYFIRIQTRENIRTAKLIKR
jgi:poly(3-hydroxybutyrate) depolymerase